MRRWKTILCLATLCAALTLTGCYESPDVTLHEPGVYKGAEDPLLAKAQDRGHADTLRERMLAVQTDR